MIGLWLNVCRFSLAFVFIFSGFVKAVDPLGTQYKIQDYLVAFGWADVFPDFLPFLMAVLLGVLEFCLGVYLFFGIRRIIAPRVLVLLMSFMTPLTLWLAIDEPVSDCGCFGDAVVLSNWQTFWKNVLLWFVTACLGLAIGYVLIFIPILLVRSNWSRYKFLISFTATCALVIMLLFNVRLGHSFNLGSAMLITIYAFVPVILSVIV